MSDTERDVDILFEAGHPSRPDRYELMRQHIDRIKAEARAEGWHAAVAALVYEDGTPVEAILNRNPFRPSRGAR